ncbi:MAG: B-box zinc finger protein [Candidatus Odinarchaeia archaeon]
MSSGMRCPYHPDEECIGFCSKCGRPVCRLCSSVVRDVDTGFFQRIRVKDMLRDRGLDKTEYICDECNKLRFKFSITDIIAISSGLLLFFIGLFIEFMPLVIIGALVFIGGLYGLLKG